MKTKFIIPALLMGAMVLACSPKANQAEAADGEVVKTSKDCEPSKALVDSVSYLLGINFGSTIKGYDFGNINYAQLEKGIKDFVNAKGNYNDPSFVEQFKINPETMGEIINRYLGERHQYTSLLNKEAGEKFLSENKKKEGVVETESGLQYRILAAGNDVHASAVDTIWVRYEGKTLEGEVFDKVGEEDEPASFTLAGVIPGWTEGMQLVGEGGEIELYVPAELAYGERGMQAIKPNSTLIFDVKVVKVGKLVETAEE